jgi:hypothetical protein
LVLALLLLLGHAFETLLVEDADVQVVRE